MKQRELALVDAGQQAVEDAQQKADIWDERLMTAVRKKVQITADKSGHALKMALNSRSQKGSFKLCLQKKH